MGEPQGELAELRASTCGRRWVFNSAVLDERSLELVVGEQPVKLERKPLEVLLYLLHHAGEVVTKDELAENLWPGRILTETVLTRCISVLRQALRDDARALIRTIHGYGYRLTAEVRVEASTAAPAPAFDFKSGDSPPQRPQWKLVERLGTGGHGEAWLARHEKTGEARVFKFALDEAALSSLKREITLSRLLHDTLGTRAAMVRVLEWNLTEPPYFLETECVEGGSLRVYAERRGGLSNIPLPERLELMAEIADALAACHSVGVLHKDLKPGNVLIELEHGRTRIKLCDFGSGGVLDPGRLEALGITQQGFTRTLARNTISGTPLYLAPEVLGGQPFTLQADIYALGVMLFQVAVGDLQRALAPGWEHEVEDELLREDIALTAAGNPARRLADAAQLAERLRTLEVRRQARTADLAAKERAERARRALQELRRVRTVAVVLLALTATAIAAGVIAYRARDEANEATVTAKAISAFLLNGVLKIDPAEPPKDLSYESLLNRAAKQVDTSFDRQPAAAASVHWQLGQRFYDLGQVDRAVEQFEGAARLEPVLDGRAAEPALLAMERLLPIYSDRGQPMRALALSDNLLAKWSALYGKRDLSTLLMRARVGKLLFEAGHVDRAERELQSIPREARHVDRPAEDRSAVLAYLFGGVMFSDVSKQPPEALAELLSAHATILLAWCSAYVDEYKEATSRIRASLAVYSRLLGDKHQLSVRARLSLGTSLTLAGDYSEAEESITAGMARFEEWLPRDHWFHSMLRLHLGQLRLEQQRPAEAFQLLRAALASQALRQRSWRVWEDGRYYLARAHQDLGHLNEAIETLRESLETFERLRGPNDLGTLLRRISLADALRLADKPSEASAVLSAIAAEALSKFRRRVVEADYLRVKGLLWLGDDEFESAVGALRESLEITSHPFGVKHWRNERGRAELAAAQRRAALHARVALRGLP